MVQNVWEKNIIKPFATGKQEISAVSVHQIWALKLRSLQNKHYIKNEVSHEGFLQ